MGINDHVVGQTLTSHTEETGVAETCAPSLELKIPTRALCGHAAPTTQTGRAMGSALSPDNLA